jgi:hypothetical protein
LRLAALPRPRVAGFRVGFFLLDAVLLLFRVLRVREVEPPEDVLLLREPGGEDVRVATPPP